MDDEKLDYPRIVQDALRDVVRRILARVADEGLPGEHFFYIGFRTDQPGVEMSRPLRDQYPEEMTIVLQHQYWDLEVAEDAFSVALNFNASRQWLKVPFAALTAFVDPTSEFGLRFDGGVAAAAGADAAGPGTAEVEPAAQARPQAASRPGEPGEVIPFGPRRRK